MQLIVVWIMQACCSSCGDHLQGSSGDLRFPISGGHVGESLQCTWTITVPERLRVKITFTDFVMKTSCCSCIHDFLEIRDGSLDNSTLIGQFCAKREPKYVFSTGNVIWIQFASNFRTYSGNRFRLYGSLYVGAISRRPQAALLRPAIHYLTKTTKIASTVLMYLKEELK